MRFILPVIIYSLLSCSFARADGLSPVLAAFKCQTPLSASEGQRLVQRAQERYSQVRTLAAEFMQDSYLAAVDQSEISQGTLAFQAKGKMRWDYDRPEIQTFIVKDGTVWLLQPRLNQVVIDTIDQIVISQLPTAFLMGLGDLNKDFKLVEACRSNKGVKLKLKPMKAGSEKESQGLEAFELLIEEQSGLPQGANVIDLGGNRTAFLFRNMKADDGRVPAKVFELEIPDGVDVDDRRGQKS